MIPTPRPHVRWMAAISIVTGSLVGAAVLALLLRGEPGSGGNSVAFTQERADRDWMVDMINVQARSEFQDLLLADGELSGDEYVEAFEAYRECVQAAGGVFIPDPVRRNERGTFAFVVHIPPVTGSGTPAADRLLRAAIDACDREYFDRVQEVWTIAHQPADEEIEAARAGIAPCLASKNVPLPDGLGQPGWASQERMAAWPRETGEAFLVCATAAGEQLGYPPGVFPLP